MGRWRRWRRRNWASFIKLALVLTLFAAVIVSGHRHWNTRWHRADRADPFPPTVTGYGDPIDGDSLWVDKEEVRLKGIDAPEWRQSCEKNGTRWDCGAAARDELVRAIGDDDVTCAIEQRDVYGRMLGRCTAGGRDLNAQMIASGMAVAYGAYWDEQAVARAERRGLWVGAFEEPRNWRREHASGDDR